MADGHPFAAHRDHHVQRQRVPHIAKGYAQGGAVHSDEAADKKLIKRELGKALHQRDAQAVEGGSAKERADRPGRARGGRAPKHKGSNVNVIVAPQGHPQMPMSAPAGVGAAPMPPRPPMPMAGPGAPPPGAGPVPPGMPIRHAGGRAYAAGGAVKHGPTFESSRHAGTQVQNNPSGKNDQKNVGRGKPVTYKTGGAIASHPTGQHAPKLPGGSGGGKARLVKAARAEHRYAKP